MHADGLRDDFLVVGLDSDPTITHFVAECHLAGLSPATINLRQVAESGGWHLSIPDNGDSRIWWSDGEVLLSGIKAAYCRPVNLASQQHTAREKAFWHGMLAAVRSWQSTTEALIINPISGHHHNGAKPLHETVLSSFGLVVPPSLTSCDRAALENFMRGRRCVVKSCSGVRATASEITLADLARYHPARGPLHVQHLIEGFDVRAHVLGSEVFALRVTAQTLDYRSRDSEAQYEPYDLPETLADTIVAATRAQGLYFAGWDFKVDSSGAHWCLEANPMPGYSMYDRRLGGSISSALMRVLMAPQLLEPVTGSSHTAAAHAWTS